MRAGLICIALFTLMMLSTFDTYAQEADTVAVSEKQRPDEPRFEILQASAAGRTDGVKRGDTGDAETKIKIDTRINVLWLPEYYLRVYIDVDGTTWNDIGEDADDNDTVVGASTLFVEFDPDWIRGVTDFRIGWNHEENLAGEDSMKVAWDRFTVSLKYTLPIVEGWTLVAEPVAWFVLDEGDNSEGIARSTRVFGDDYGGKLPITLIAPNGETHVGLSLSRPETFLKFVHDLFPAWDQFTWFASASWGRDDDLEGRIAAPDEPYRWATESGVIWVPGG